MHVHGWDVKNEDVALSEWWSEEIFVAVAGKGRAFEEQRQRRDRNVYDRYRAERAVVNQAV